MAGARTYTKVARAAAEEGTRAALIEAAHEAFLAGSWPGASLEAIAGRAGVTKQTLLRHFGSKEGLLEQAYARAFAEIREQRFGAPAGDVEGAVDNLLEHYEEHGQSAMKIGAMAGEGVLGQIGVNARRMHYEWVEHAFGPRLDRARGRARAQLRAALIAACDVQTWWILSHDLGLGRRDVRATLILTVNRLLGEEA